MIDYQPEMDPDEELYPEGDRESLQGRAKRWEDVRAAAGPNEDRVAEYRRQIEDSIRRGVALAKAGEVMPADEVASVAPLDLKKLALEARKSGVSVVERPWVQHPSSEAMEISLRRGQAPPALTSSFHEFCRDAQVMPLDPVEFCRTMPYESVARSREAVEDERHKMYADFLLVKHWAPGHEEKFDGLGQLLSILEGRECESCGAQGGGHLHECPR